MVKVRCQTLHRCNACGKNVCDSIIGTLLSIKGKTNDGINARKDLVEMGVWLELQPQPHGKQHTCHQLVTLCQKLKRLVSVGIYEELNYHKDTLRISKVSYQWKI